MNFFIYSVLSLVGMNQVMAVTIAPIVSTFGDNFRSGETTVSLSSSVSNYDYAIPYSYIFSESSIALALSLIDYNQVFDSSNRTYYYLYDNVPTPSNNTHAVFRVFIGYPASTSRAKVRYLASMTSLFSDNFRIVTVSFSPGVMAPNSYFKYNLTQTYNLTSFDSVTFMSGVDATRYNGTSYYYYITFGYWPPLIMIAAGLSYMNYTNLQVTLIYVNPQVTDVTYRIPFLAPYGSNTGTTNSKIY